MFRRVVYLYLVYLSVVVLLSVIVAMFCTCISLNVYFVLFDLH